MKHAVLFLSLCASLLGLTVACKSTQDTTQRAEELASKFLIVDTHVDVPYRLREKMEDNFIFS